MMAATPAASSEDETAILDAVGKWLERDVRPHVHALEKDDIYPAEMVEQMKALGLFGATIGQAYGGLGLSATTYARIVQRVSEVWMSLAGIFNSHLIMAACVERVGTEEQKRAYLPRFATGELRGGLALTEPDCGTDLQAIRTRDEIFTRLRAHFSEAQIVEMTWRTALCGAFNRFNDILQLDIEPGVVVREAAE